MRWAVLVIFGTIGLVLFAGGARWGLESYPVYRDSISTRGTVVDLYEEKGGKSSDVVYYPVVEFLTGSNAKVRFRDGTGALGAPAYETGAPVNVLYDPVHPADARIGSFMQLWSGPLTAWGIGLVLLFLTLLLFVKIGRFEKGLKALGSGKRRESGS